MAFAYSLPRTYSLSFSFGKRAASSSYCTAGVFKLHTAQVSPELQSPYGVPKYDQPPYERLPEGHPGLVDHITPTINSKEILAGQEHVKHNAVRCWFAYIHIKIPIYSLLLIAASYHGTILQKRWMPQVA